MKRAPWYVLAGTIAGFAGVLSLHGRPAASAAPPQPKATGGSGTGSQGAGQSGSQGTGTAGTGTGSASGGVKSATGALEQYGYGELSVKVTVHGSQITEVTVPTLRTAEPYSQQLATQVIPMLKSEVLSAHSARINGVSGATYTSQAYAASLQSALDKLHIK